MRAAGREGRSVGLAAQQGDDHHTRQEAEEEAGARADQGQRGGAVGEHRQADRTGRQIGGDGGTGLK